MWALRQPAHEGARGGIEGCQAGGALRRQAEPALEVGHLDPHAVPVRRRPRPRVRPFTRETFITELGEGRKTTWGIVLHARSCAMMIGGLGRSLLYKRVPISCVTECLTPLRPVPLKNLLQIEDISSETFSLQTFHLIAFRTIY
jgi:hypothetical protein